MSATHHTSTAQAHKSPSFRLTLLDAVKLVAMVMMMQGHTLDAVVRPAEMDLTHFPWIIWYHLRGFTAPTFLVVSGMLFALTIKSSSSGSMQLSQAWKRVRWAIILAVLGYLQAFPASNIFHLRFVEPSGWQLFFQVNILQLNAVALSMITLAALATRNDQQFGRASLIACLFFCFAAPWVNNVPWFSILPEWIAGFLSYEHGSYFPIFPFASYMFFGAAIGSRMRRVPKDQQQSFLTRASLRLGGVLLLAGVVVYIIDPLLSWMPQLDVLKSMPSTVLLRCSFVLLITVIISKADAFLRRYHKPIELFGKQSLVIYIVHIVIVFGTSWFSSFGRIYFKSLPLGAGLVLALMVVISTLFLVYVENLVRHRQPWLHRVMQASLVLGLMYCLLA